MQNLRNILFNLIIFERRQFCLRIKENISVSHITHVLCDCADIYLFNSKKRNIQEIPSNQRNVSFNVFQCPNLFDSKKFCLNQRKLFSGCGNSGESYWNIC